MPDSKTSVIPEFAATGLDEIPKIADTLRTTFKTHRTKDVDFRLKQLRKLYWALVDNTSLIQDALYQDLHLCKYEADLVEIDPFLNDLRFAIKNLEKWVKDEPVSGISPMFYTMRHHVRKEPLGTVLIIGPYNFPFQLNLMPLFGAIAAGCTVAVKPSESAPASAMVLQKIFEDSLDSTAYRIINGAIEESKALLEEKWDKIFYTGGSEVGKIISMQAAKTLTPVALELGGMNPAFVTKNAKLSVAARRMMWGKTMVAGQVCLSQNYCLVERSVVPGLIEALKESYAIMFPKGAKESPDYGRVINKKQFLRIKKMVDESGGKIVLGGAMDESELFIEPTVVLVESPKDSLLAGETFGPVFSILPYDTLERAIMTANDIYSTPLALYAFGNEDECKKIVNSIQSGGATINDILLHSVITPAPMGGIGMSGHGCYRGKASFDTFTHFRTMANNPTWTDKLLRVRYMPFAWNRLQRLPGRPPRSGSSVGFDRQGNRTKGLGFWFGFLASLGAKEARGTLLRWILILVSAYVLTRRRAVAAA